jgi:ribose 5-phosphate isomerase A
VVEKHKLVERLGAFPLPLEIIPFGYKHCLNHLDHLGYQPRLRMEVKSPYMTDAGHFIVDIHPEIQDPFELDTTLKKIPGIVENGLFLKLVNKVVVANGEDIDIITFR